MKKRKNFIFPIYLLALFLFVVIKFKGSLYEIYDRIQSVQWNRELGNWNYNFILFKTIKEQFLHISNMWALKNLIGNIIAFMPLGYFIKLYFCKEKPFIYFFSICLVSIIAIEIIQFITMVGSFDVDDILLNIIGCTIGYLCYKIINIFLQS